MRRSARVVSDTNSIREALKERKDLVLLVLADVAHENSKLVSSDLVDSAELAKFGLKVSNKSSCVCRGKVVVNYDYPARLGRDLNF